jgi:Ca2+-binding RTX toxin-like protein
MAAYAFSTITAAQALAIGAGDALNLDEGSAVLSSVAYLPADGVDPERISLSVGARTAVFGAGLSEAAKTFADGSTLFVGGNGNDSPPIGGALNDAFFGGLGADTLSAGGGFNVLQGNQGADILTGGSGVDWIYGGRDDDQISVGASASGGFANFSNGNRGSDTISGSSTDADILLGGQGNDLIGATSFDLAVVDADGIPTGAGLSGGGADFLNGNLGDDTVVGGPADDQIYGEDGNDILLGKAGRNTLDGGLGDDTIVGSGGSDTIYFGGGDDIGGLMGAGAASDSAFLDGGAGDDNINGGEGRDLLVGGDGEDVLDGWASADTMTGGAGGDRFQLWSGDSGVVATQLDRITDWAGGEDHLFFGNGGAGTGVGAGSSANYVEGRAADHASALYYANTQVVGGAIDYVAVQVGGDVVVFADTGQNNGAADSAVLLVGRSLSDIAFAHLDADGG